jgi:hypothetical protein
MPAPGVGSGAGFRTPVRRTAADGEVAPVPVVRVTPAEPRISTLNRHSRPGQRLVELTRKRTCAGERIRFCRACCAHDFQQGQSRYQRSGSTPTATFGDGQSAAFVAISSATFHGPRHVPPIMPTGWNSVGRLARHPLLIRARTCRQVCGTIGCSAGSRP